MALREKLLRLKGLIDPGTILAAYGATKDDLDMLAKVEDVFEKIEPKGREGKNG
jgi:hypothetical protein